MAQGKTSKEMKRKHVGCGFEVQVLKSHFCVTVNRLTTGNVYSTYIFSKKGFLLLGILSFLLCFLLQTLKEESCLRSKKRPLM